MGGHRNRCGCRHAAPATARSRRTRGVAWPGAAWRGVGCRAAGGGGGGVQGHARGRRGDRAEGRSASSRAPAPSSAPGQPRTMGPRHTAATSSSIRNPMDMHATPWLISGIIFSSAGPRQHEACLLFSEQQRRGHANRVTAAVVCTAGPAACIPASMQHPAHSWGRWRGGGEEAGAPPHLRPRAACPTGTSCAVCWGRTRRHPAGPP